MVGHLAVPALTGILLSRVFMKMYTGTCIIKIFGNGKRLFFVSGKSK